MTSKIRSLVLPPASRIPESVEDWLVTLGAPSWIRIPGVDRSRTRVVTTLLHGDEPSGVRAMHAWLRSGSVPPTDVAFYVGSVQAALAVPGFGRRSPLGMRDANRTFAPPFEGPEGELSRELLDRIEQTHPEALVDLHNNSGNSPAYGVGTRAEPIHLSLTSLFADRFMLSDLRLGTLVEATEDLTPSLVVECGRGGDPVADAIGLAGLERFLSLEALAPDGTPPRAVEVLHHPVRVRIRPEIGLTFAERPDPSTTLTLRPHLDRHNFEAIPEGFVIGWLGATRAWPFDARGASGTEVSRDYFAAEEGVIVTRRRLVPIMMTTSAEMAKSDCLFYAMERR